MKALIIGAGNMGALYDTPETEEILSHAHAFYVLKEIEDFAFCDLNEENLKEATIRWGKVCYTDIKDALSSYKPNLVSVCVSTNYHLSVIKEVVQYESVETIILEKPSGKNLTEALEIQKLISEYNKKIIINFSRNYSEGIENLKVDISLNKFGALQHINGIYTKGLVNNCSHLLSILCLFWPNIEFLGKDKSIIDFKPEDPTVSFRLKIGPALCSIAGLSETSFSHFEIDFFFEKARIKLSRFGFDLLISYVEEDKIFGPKYKTLGKESLNSLGLEHSLKRLVLKIINNENNNGCSMENCIRVHKLIDAIK
jgi:hypothetical protein